MKTTFYLVRHGQPDWDWAEAMRFYGPCSAYMPLTPLGVEQIEHTACDSQLRGASFILASPTPAPCSPHRSFPGGWTCR
ncbi:MAG: histidine phosphatase family protein [Angelakisella sp.]